MVLISTLLSVFFADANLQKYKKTQASSISTLSPLSEISINETAANSINSSVSSDMDDEGNQVYVWSFTETISGNICKGLRYQRFQISGLPLTSKTDIVSNCSAGSNTHQYLNPSVSSDRTGNFITSWTDIVPSVSTDIKIQAISAHNTAIGSPTIAEDASSKIVTTASSRIALNKNDSSSSMNFGVSWLGCTDGTDCSSARKEYRAQIYSVNFSTSDNPVRINTDNLILNPTDYAATSEAPTIAFSTTNFLVAWHGSHVINQVTDLAIYGRAINQSGTVSENVFQLTNFNGHESQPELTGVLRPIAHGNAASDVFYISFSSDHLGTGDIYAQKIICASASQICASTTRTSGEPIFVRANTSTSGEEILSSIKVFSNKNYADKTYGQEGSGSDYLNISWCSFDGDTTSKIYSQNFKNDLSRISTEVAVDTMTTNCPLPPSVAMDEDANYSISYINAENDKIYSKIYPSLYLRIEAETLIHAPDNTAIQSNPKTAINSNGNHLIAYESTNADGFKDIIYSLYDKNGNAIQNSSIANQSSAADHDNQDLAFFNENIGSPDYGKFIITWHYDNNVDAHGIYYQLFNADGSKLGDETLVTTDQLNFPTVSAGKFKQFLIAYRDGVGAEGLNSIQYLYQNNGNSITGTASDTSSTTINKAFATLSPNADGSTGSEGNSKFVIAWNDSSNYNYKEGFLASATTVSLGSVLSNTGNNIYDSSTAIVPSLGSLQPAKNPLMYAFITVNGSNHTQVYPYTYGDGLLLNSAIDLGIQKPNPRISIDRSTGNILTTWEGFNNFTDQLNSSQILMFTKDSHTIHSVNDHVTGDTSSAQADIKDGDFINNYYYELSGATGPFTIGETLSTDAGTFTPDTVGAIKAQFFRFSLDQPSDSSTWITKFGPEFSPNTRFDYGQYLGSPDIAFDSSSSEDGGKLAIFSYAISSNDTYLDNNGILKQMIEDPFSIGQKQDLSSATNQRVTPGGKYIVVPRTIDFGDIIRGSTSSVNFSDLTMPDSSSGRLEVTDIDGANFDLTASLSTLTNSSDNSKTIANTHFIIENNDGINTSGDNPGVSTNYTFTNVNDVVLDPSTDPDQDANLSTTQTLLRKNNNNTGVWNIYPKVKLDIPSDAVNGIYTGAITFTLI